MKLLRKAASRSGFESISRKLHGNKPNIFRNSPITFRAMASSPTRKQSYTITLLGDIVLARLIDQLLPVHVQDHESAHHISHFRQKYPHLSSDVYKHASPWGNTLLLLHKSDLVLGNLETAVTSHEIAWPNKIFNYRMHPQNTKCLTEAKVSYLSLANNHTLDFGREGLEETVKVVREAGIATAGAVRVGEQVGRPAVLKLRDVGGTGAYHEVHLYSFSDHPTDWRSVQEFNFLDYTNDFKKKTKQIMNQHHDGRIPKPALKVVSCHWGPNYQWHPDDRIISMAHFFIDECGVDIIHGHSSHHIQGVEVYKGKLIVYGCGDFVDDYAVTPEYRNDLSATWNVIVEDDESVAKLKPVRLEVYPNRIRHFQAGLLAQGDKDYDWVREKFVELSSELNTTVAKEIGSDGQIIVEISS